MTANNSPERCVTFLFRFYHTNLLVYWNCVFILDTVFSLSSFFGNHGQSKMFIVPECHYHNIESNCLCNVPITKSGEKPVMKPHESEISKKKKKSKLN